MTFAMDLFRTMFFLIMTFLVMFDIVHTRTSKVKNLDTLRKSLFRGKYFSRNGGNQLKQFYRHCYST